MAKLLLILATFGLSLHFADIGSESTFISIVLPIVVVLSLISLALWLVMYFHHNGISQQASPGDAGSFLGGFDGSGDGGSGC